MEGEKVIRRFANVIYWLCTTLTILFVAGAIATAIAGSHQWEVIASIFVAIGAVVWVFGRAVRYILVGPSEQ